jgi:hypothetical protein
MMITPSELQDLVLAYIYRSLGAPGGSPILRFSEIEQAFQPFVGPRLVRTALERIRMATSREGCTTCLIDTEVKLYEDDVLVGDSDWVIKCLRPEGEAKIEREIMQDGSILNRYLRKSEPLASFFAANA